MKKYNNVILSHPKCGRTWTRAFMILYEQETKDRRVKKIKFRHAYKPKKYRKFVHVVRQPHDVLVSFYFERKYRSRNRVKKQTEGIYNGMESFIRGAQGAQALSEYWRNIPNAENIMTVRYEDLFHLIWPDILTFFNIKIDWNALIKVDKMCEFNTLKENLHLFEDMEGQEAFMPNGKSQDSHKFRRGKINGYTDYLNGDLIDYITKTVPEAKRWYD